MPVLSVFKGSVKFFIARKLRSEQKWSIKDHSIPHEPLQNKSNDNITEPSVTNIQVKIIFQFNNAHTFVWPSGASGKWSLLVEVWIIHFLDAIRQVAKCAHNILNWFTVNDFVMSHLKCVNKSVDQAPTFPKLFASIIACWTDISVDKEWESF